MNRVETKGWGYSINYGPDGEENWANLTSPSGALVGNIPTHHAMEIVRGMNASTPIAAGGGEATQVKLIATKFFRWWWNQPGANTDQGYDEWAETEGASLLAALSPCRIGEETDAFETCAKVAEGHADLIEEMRRVYPGDPHGALGRDANKMRKLAKAIRALRPSASPPSDTEEKAP